MDENFLKGVKKTVAIFAHPDDESFGPSGTIAKLSETGETYIICITDGGKTGINPEETAQMRREEILKASRILGVKDVFFLNYKDGELNNNLYHIVYEDIKKILLKVKPDNILTFELRGLSGHIDHVFASMVTSFAYRKLKFIKTLMYFCNPDKMSSLEKTYFIFFPPGYKKEDVDLVVNIKPYLRQKVSAIKCHRTQIKDVIFILGLLKIFPKEEYFLVKKR